MEGAADEIMRSLSSKNATPIGVGRPKTICLMLSRRVLPDKTTDACVRMRDSRPKKGIIPA